MIPKTADLQEQQRSDKKHSKQSEHCADCKLKPGACQKQEFNHT